ncbi:BRO1 domain-containing protein BROX-like family protein [Onchocerca flexuosa]|uniref:BRO1 domain-containing protein BROX-like family protein n=1 Tax=Onchocerca flexuosa TaxID=387005 RepID=A0A238C403_9BILA|nr:BRO1 domain-containing protein BROX-like family protein [Onchocerca flexuosa]
MAHWFHRNPIKATEHADFLLKSILTTSQASKICNELRLRRAHLLEHFKDASNNLDVLDDEFKQYLSLFSGFIFAVDHDNTKTSKLAALLRFRWSNSMLGLVATEASDSWFEVLNICVNMALWLSKHAAWIAAKDEVFEADAKEAHTCLRRAAGILIFVRENADRVTGLTSFPGSDFDPAVLTAYINQFTAEAQEITMARAIELKHSPSLITALAYETSHLFTQADESLGKLDQVLFGKWRYYLQFKSQIYTAYAYAFLGENLLSQDKCGDAVRACREGISCFNVAVDFAGKYRKTNGPGTIVKPESHLFFRRIRPLLERHMEKAERENGFIYHQKVPDICPELGGKPTFGLVEAEPFTLPSMNPLWTATAYAAFDISKVKMPDFSKVKKKSKTLPSVQEEKVYETERDPSSLSGCTIS